MQRCTKHKQDNLLTKAPKRLHRELIRDYREIIDAETEDAGKKQRAVFRLKWKRLCGGVVKSLDEADDELLTFMAFPRSQWKSLRTTNQIERFNTELKRRTKTQGSFRSEDSALVLLYGLLAMEQIRLRKIDGWKEHRTGCRGLARCRVARYATPTVRARKITPSIFHGLRDATQATVSI